MSKKQTVLIAEDDKFLAKMMSKVLAAHDVQSFIASTGKEALDHLESNAPSLLLLDLLMPEIDGYEVLQRLQSSKSGVPVVVVSNLGDAKTIERCKKLGAKAYVVKSDIDDQQLWPVVEKFL